MKTKLLHKFQELTRVVIKIVKNIASKSIKYLKISVQKIAETLKPFLLEVKGFLEGYFSGEYKVKPWVKLVIFLFFLIVGLFIGALIGYSVLGEGKMIDVFKPSTWWHIIEIIKL